jgi:hypothetical protein
MASALRATWGVTTKSGVDGYGIVVGVEIGSEGSFITETDIEGAVNGVFCYDTKQSNSCDIMIKAGTPPPSIGARINIGGNYGYVTDVRVVESNATYQKMRISVSSHEKVDRASIVT